MPIMQTTVSSSIAAIEQAKVMAILGLYQL
jgi:hypothetical protein